MDVISDGATMKAVRLHKEGGPEQLAYEDAPKPQLGAGDALIRVHATGITPAELTWAETYRNCDGSERLPAIPGHEVSGVVESVAPEVTGISIGDEVYALTSFCRPVIAQTVPLAEARTAFERGVAEPYPREVGVGGQEAVSASRTRTRRFAAGIALLAVCAFPVGASSGRDSSTAGDDVRLVRTEKLANVAGQTLTVVTVGDPPGGTFDRVGSAPGAYYPEASRSLHRNGKTTSSR
jgi:hypothetical protein